MVVTLTAQLGDMTFTDDPAANGDVGTLWKVQDLDGWWSAPVTETDADPIPLADGNFEGLTFRRAKKWSLNGVVSAASPVLARQAWQRLAGLGGSGQALTATVTDELGTRTQRVRLDSAPQVIPYGKGNAFFRIPVVAADPRKYGPTLAQQRGVGLPAATDGLAFPLFAPGYLDFGAFTGTNSVALLNTGTAPTFPSFAVTGYFDAAGFTIASDAGDLLTFQRTVSSGSTVLLSPFAGGRATLDGSDQTVFLTTANWSAIPPGGSRAYTLFAAGQSDTSAGMTVTYREAWW